MNFLPRSFSRLVINATLPCITILGVGNVQAQAPPGPLPQATSKDTPASSQTNAPPSSVPRTKNLTGTWRLNVDDSDDPRKKLQQAHGSSRGSQGGARRSGGMGGGWPGGGLGGRGTGSGESDSDRQKMQLFLQPAQQLVVLQKEPEIDVTDDDDRKFALYTDNRKIEKSKDANRQEFAAKWDQFRLVAEGKDPHGNKYQRSYEVLEGNQQLQETLFLKVGRNDTEIAIHYVYDLVSPARSAAPRSP